MFYIFIWAGLIVCNGLASTISRRFNHTVPIHLGDFKPTCAKLSDSSFGDINSGIKLNDFKTFITFGDSWTDLGNRVGGTPLPAVKPKAACPFYGSRPTNGMMWSEWLLQLLGIDAEVKSYAVSGATVSHELWRSANKKADMAEEIDVFLCQENKIDMSSSIVALFFGNNDLSASRIESNGMTSLIPAAKKYLFETERLIKAGLTSFLILAPAFSSNTVKEFNKVIWEGLGKLREQYSSLKFITVDLSELYNAIKASPQSFGYRSTDSCLEKNADMQKACTDPDYRLYFIYLHPQKYTHMLQAQFIKLVAETCDVSNSEGRSSPLAEAPPSVPAATNKDADENPRPENCKDVSLIQSPPKCI